MKKEIFVRWLDQDRAAFLPMKLTLEDGKAADLRPAADRGQEFLYMSDGWIDSHAHVYDGGTDLGIEADSIGYGTGVHLVADAGSAGAVNMPCFRKYVLPAQKVRVRAFLNIGRCGLVCKQPYYDARLLDADAAEQCLRSDTEGFLLGIKVLSSGLIVEHQGLKPIRTAAALAEKLQVPLMAHLTEGPPVNDDTMALMKAGDIITHCFHGAPNIAANRKASRGAPIDPQYCSVANIMWNPDGTPTRPLEKALEKGVRLDVGHGAGSFDMHVAGAVIGSGFCDFSISTDAHCRSLTTVVHSLPHVMSKFLSLGMPLTRVIRSVTAIPADNLRLNGWCGNPLQRSTVFRVRKTRPDDPPFADSNRTVMDVREIIEPVALIRNGIYEEIEKQNQEGYNGARNDS